MLARSTRLFSPSLSVPCLLSSARWSGAVQTNAACIVGCALLSLCSSVQAAAIPVQADFGSPSIKFHATSTLYSNMSTSASGEMEAVVAADSKCVLVKRPMPVPKAGEALVRVLYTAINRADTLQRKGLYPPPPGVTDVLGLEFVGEVVSYGPSTDAGTSLPVGTRVMGLLSGGGNAGYATIPAAHLIPVPDTLESRSAAGIPETWLTAFQLLRLVGNATSSDRILIHAAASGVGTAAVQIAKHIIGATVIGVASADEKLSTVTSLGADHVVNYKTNEAWGKQVLEATENKGVTLILDPVGGSFWKQNMEAIGMDGRWVLYGTMGGGSVEGGLFAQMLRKRVTITATTLRSRTDEYKSLLTRQFTSEVLPVLASGKLKPIIDTEFELKDIQAAHEYMESNASVGKIVIKVA